LKTAGTIGTAGTFGTTSDAGEHIMEATTPRNLSRFQASLGNRDPSVTPIVAPAAPPKPKLLDQVRQAIRFRHLSYNTEQAYVGWIKRFIFFHNKRHPAEMRWRLPRFCLVWRLSLVSALQLRTRPSMPCCFFKESFGPKDPAAYQLCLQKKKWGGFWPVWKVLHG
jgi:hypothetical protein